MRTFSGVMSPRMRTAGTRGREGMAGDEVLRHTELTAYGTHFIFEEQAKGLTQPQIHLFGEDRPHCDGS